MSMAGELEGKAAIVTGGGTGLGAATAAMLARRGARVVITGRRQDKLEASAGCIRAEGGEVLCSLGDISQAADVERTVRQCVETFGRVDILVNNAGQHARFRHTHEVAIAEFDECIAINLRGPVLATRAVLPHMLEAGGGRIVNVASMAGLVGLRYAAPYSTAKGGLIQLTRAVAVEYASRGIIATCITPGGMQPAENMDHFDDAQRALVQESIKQGSPLGRPAHVDEVASLIAHLVGPNGAPMAGAILAIDGGFTAQ